MKKFLIFSICIFCILLCFQNDEIVFASSYEKPFVVKNRNNEKTSNEMDEKISVEEAIDELLSGLDLSDLEKFYNKYTSDSRPFREFLKDILSGKSENYSELFGLVTGLIKNELFPILGVGSCIVAIIILCGLISSLSPSKSGSGEVVFAVCYGAISLILFGEIAVILKDTGKVILDMASETQLIFPLLLTLVSVSGGSISSEIYKPVCVFLTNGIMMAISKYMLPLLSAILVISVISNLSEKYTLKELHSFLCDLFKWITGGMAGLFSFFVTLKGITASTIDGVSIRALKYTMGNGIPVIGGFAKEGIDVFLSAGILIKNATGTVALLVIFTALFLPFIKLVLMSLSLKFISAVAEPVVDGRICHLISSFSKTIGMASALMITIFVLYTLVIILIIFTQSAVVI